MLASVDATSCQASDAEGAGLKEFSNCVKKALVPLMLNLTTASREDWVEIRPSYQVQQTKRRRRRQMR